MLPLYVYNKLNTDPQIYALLSLKVWWPRFDGLWKGELEIVVKPHLKLSRFFSGQVHFLCTMG